MHRELIGDKPEANGVKERLVIVTINFGEKKSVCMSLTKGPKPSEKAFSIFWENQEEENNLLL